MVRKGVVDRDSSGCISFFSSAGGEKRRKPRTELEATGSEITADGEIPEPEYVRSGSVGVERDRREDSVDEVGFRKRGGKIREVGAGRRVVILRSLAANTAIPLPVTNLPA